MAAKKCLDVRTTAATKQPKNPEVKRELAAAHIRLGEILLECEDLASCGKEFDQALAMLEELLDEEHRSAGAKAALAVNHGWIATVALRRGDLAVALKEATLSNKLCKEVDTDDPDSTRTTRDLAVSFERLGDILLAQGQTDKAVEAFLESEKALYPIERVDQVSALAKRSLAHARERLGAGQLANGGEATAAVISLNGSVDLRERCSRQTPRFRPPSGSSLLDSVCWPMLTSPFTSDMAARKVSVFAEVVDADKANGPARRELALASGKWGELLAENGKPTVALIVVSQSVDQFRTLSGEKDNAHAQADMATALECQSAVYTQIGQTDAGLKAACAALAIRTELAKKAGDTKAALRDRANSMILVADSHAARCEFVRARET